MYKNLTVIVTDTIARAGWSVDVGGDNENHGGPSVRVTLRGFDRATGAPIPGSTPQEMSGRDAWEIANMLECLRP